MNWAFKPYDIKYRKTYSYTYKFLYFSLFFNSKICFGTFYLNLLRTCVYLNDINHFMYSYNYSSNWQVHLLAKSMSFSHTIWEYSKNIVKNNYILLSIPNPHVGMRNKIAAYFWFFFYCYRIFWLMFCIRCYNIFKAP